MGFGQEMTSAEYHAHKAISKSKLDAARKSGRHLYDMLYGPPRESKPHFDLGIVLHASALPGEDADEIAARKPEGMDMRTKEGKAFLAEHKGKIILNSSDAYSLDQMMLSLDFILDDLSLILDLKTTIDASPKGFQRSVANYRYFVQASHYLDVVEMSTGTRPQGFLFVAVEKQRPFSTAVYLADQPMINLGKQQAREDLNNIAQWIADDKFPGYSERVEEISLPKWMLPKEDGTPADHQPIELY